MTIDCTLSIRDESGSYYINAFVTMLSIFENTHEHIRVHILHDDTIHHGKEKLEELCASYGQEILFHKVPDFDPEMVKQITRWFNLGATYRYFAHELIDAGRAVYLDCDVIVNRDLKDLHTIEIGNHLLAGVRDQNNRYWNKTGQPKAKYKNKVNFLGCSRDNYINSGVLLLNLARIRELSRKGNIFVEATIKALELGIELPYPDQDIINFIASSVPNGLLLLDDSFNFWNKMVQCNFDDLEGKIVHYVVEEPSNYFFPAHLLFWKYYAKTPFADDMFKLMDNAYSSNGMNFVRAYLNNSRRRRQAEDFLNYGVLGMLSRGIKRAIRKSF